MQTDRQAFRARYVFPIVSPPIADGVVTVEKGRIIAVGRQGEGCRHTDLGNVAILPGLINAHTHLELSGLAKPLGEPGMGFSDWVRLVISYRRSSPDYAAGIAAGKDECLRTGQAAVGDIVSAAWSENDGGDSLEATAFHETIGLRRDLIDPRLAAATSYLQTPLPPSCRHGLSPHAPYSVHPELFDRLIALAASARAPIAFHLAESREELDLLARGGGPLRDFLIDLDAWDETAIPRGTRPLDYLRRLAASGVRALVIHGNYLDEEELALMAAHAEQLSVIYCPRTHAFFQHARHPLPRLLAAGANVALGTDSRASNPDLNLLAEAAYVARHSPELAPNTVLELVTLRAARALGLQTQLGSMEPGKRADLAVVPLAEADAADPHWLVFESCAASPWEA